MTFHRLILAAVLLCAACSRPAPVDLAALQHQVRADIEAGEYPRAAETAQRGLGLAVQARDLHAEWRFRLQQAFVLLMSNEAEHVLSVLTGDMPDTPAFGALSAERLLLESRAHGILRLEDTDLLLERAWQTAVAANAQEVMGDIESIRGLRLLQQGLFEESEAVFARARDRARAIGSAYQEAGLLINLGLLHLKRARLDEAAGYFEEAARLAGPERTVMYWAAQHNLAICLASLGESGRAIDIFRQAIQHHEHAGAQSLLADAVGELGRTCLLQGDLRQAASYMERALALSLQLKRTGNAAVWASNLSSLNRELGDLSAAEKFNQQSIDLRLADKSPIYFNELNAGWIAVARGDRPQAQRLLAAAVRDGGSDPSILWDAEEGLGRLDARQGRPAEAVRHFEAAVGLVERTRSSLTRTEFKLPFLTRLIELYREYVDTLLSQGQIERALAVADSSRAQVVAERSGAGPVRRLPPGAFRATARASHAVLLSYWLGPEKSHVWVATASELHHVELPPAAQIEALVTTYQEAVERQVADPLRAGLPAGERLFATLIAPVRQWIPPGSNVIVTPDGALHGLNLESLPVPGDKPHYWLEDVTISIAPSLALLAPRAHRATPRQQLLLIGDAPNVDLDFPALRYAAGEIAAVQRRFGPDRSVVVDGARATPAAWRAADPAAFSTIHFTAHATANAESPLDSAVLLAGGKLYAREIMATPLNADLVTVSACRGVGTRLYSGEGLVGFAWAFLHAGARHVIASLWDVNDESTSRLMDVLYRELANGKSTAEALHIAKLTLAQSDSNRRKPYYWAPFQLYTIAR